LINEFTKHLFVDLMCLHWLQCMQRVQIESAFAITRVTEVQTLSTLEILGCQRHCWRDTRIV